MHYHPVSTRSLALGLWQIGVAAKPQRAVPPECSQPDLISRDHLVLLPLQFRFLSIGRSSRSLRHPQVKWLSSAKVAAVRAFTSVTNVVRASEFARSHTRRLTDSRARAD